MASYCGGCIDFSQSVPNPSRRLQRCLTAGQHLERAKFHAQFIEGRIAKEL